MKIALLGYGIETESAYRYYSKHLPDAQFTVYDNHSTPKKQLPEGVEFSGGVTDFQDIDADIVVRTPAINPARISTNGKITSVTREFFEVCPVPIIGVTGTKGKGTTSSLIAAMLQKAGIRTWTVGNIGTPALDVIDEIKAAGDGVVVYELSSFQLWDMSVSPHVAVVLMIEPEHLDVHGNIDNYIDAKSNIARHQSESDLIVYNSDNAQSQKIASLSSASRKVAYDGGDDKIDSIVLNGSPLIAKSEIGLKGKHNRENIYAALAAVKEFTDDRPALAEAIREFKGLPHRIEELGKRNGILYVNDSFSSAPPATLAAVNAYDQPIVLIMGGYDRGIDLRSLVDNLVAKNNLKHVVLIGQTASSLREFFGDRVSTENAETFEDAFHKANDAASDGDVVLLSPGCASFDMFKDFTERGEQFRKLVNDIQREFVFDHFEFDPSTKQASFYYSFDDYDTFIERVIFDEIGEYNNEILQRALFLAFIIIGTSYCKVYPGVKIGFRHNEIDQWQADFLNSVYQEGMSQYAYENNLTRQDLAHFNATGKAADWRVEYGGTGMLSLQSGGKDSLLTAVLLGKNEIDFDSFYIASRGGHHPELIDKIPGSLHVAERILDLDALKKHLHSGGLNGHVPVTFIVLALSLVQAVLLNKNTITVSIGHEGEEPHEWIGDLPITHQWSKTWQAEQLIGEYVNKYVSDSIRIGSPLRRYTELKVAELFIENAWSEYGHLFSSCNVANYKQGNDNTKLTWCGNCPKCANSFLLFAPFLPADELKSLFTGQDLFEKPSLQHTFKGLLGIDDVTKPFECVGEIDELRLAYAKSQEKGGYARLSFEVPESHFDYLQEYPSQAWTRDLF